MRFAGLLVLRLATIGNEDPLIAIAKCKVRADVRFLYAKGDEPIEIHRQLTKMYGCQKGSQLEQRLKC